VRSEAPLERSPYPTVLSRKPLAPIKTFNPVNPKEPCRRNGARDKPVGLVPAEEPNRDNKGLGIIVTPTGVGQHTVIALARLLQSESRPFGLRILRLATSA
jgi:hypothetical protein